MLIRTIEVPDDLGRLTRAVTGNTTGADTYDLRWTYDRYGNRKTQSSVGGTLSVTSTTLSFDTATNRITGVSYDNAGNSTSVDGHTYAYDAENRAKTIDGNPANHVYDAAGVRVKNGRRRS